MKQVNIAIAEAKEQGIIPTPELARERLNGLATFVSEVPEITFCDDRQLISGETIIPVKLYSPAPDKPLPVMIFFHGGGHMCGSAELYDPMCRKLSLNCHCIVISVDYRLAPENPYPAGLEDAEYALHHYKDVLSDIAHNERLIIAGDSAGGALCASLAMKQAQSSEFCIDQQVLIYPSVDYTMSQPSLNENGEGYFLEKARIEWYFDHYFEDKSQCHAASPLFGTFSNKMPETLVIIAGCDPLRDEGLAYADKLAKANVAVTTHQFEGMIHAFMNIEDIVPEECRQLYDYIADFINSK